MNDPQRADLIIHYLQDFAEDLESKAKVSDIKVELIDRAGLRVAASLTVAAIAAVAAGGSTVGNILLLAFAVPGLGVGGTSLTVIKTGGHQSATEAIKVRRLAAGPEVRK